MHSDSLTYLLKYDFVFIKDFHLCFILRIHIGGFPHIALDHKQISR